MRCTYIDAHRGSWKSAKHAAQWETTLAMYASPVIGALPVADVDTDLVVKVLAPIWKTKTETATRLRGRIESILDWAATRKLRHDINPARWRATRRAHAAWFCWISATRWKNATRPAPNRRSARPSA